ncbi:phosphotransferase family protein [Solirubrobacter ginsenosidimutans]|uniref:Phosphotransferase family protein n=1 Tax=Solirubrobacter ginsenosidimutans TaxID=490573 RepID=A0A9X3S5J3_9ACTN|nr:phosphotransferase family protein [Solirubrobacter ginsenosidimutans]MDA0166844.1 phosphotransferase family protein [Solirubrobacter ginsenosidimutans]
MSAIAVVGLESAAVSEWILGLDLDARGPLRFTRAGNGKSNLTYLVTDAAGQRWILRRAPVGPRLASAHDVARECRVLRALESTAVPAPAVLAFTNDAEVSEAPLLLLAFVDGQVPGEVGLDPAACSRLTEALIASLARVHDVDLRATGLDDLAPHTPYAARQLKRWRRQWEASRTRDLPAVERLADRLEAAVPEQRELALVHGDYHLLNVIAAPGGETIRAIVDWELCTLGDPLADLGGLLAYWPQDADARAWTVPIQRAAGFPPPAKVAELYAAATGRDLDALGFWHALGLWKVAIICEGVRRRALDDERNAARTGIPPAHAVEDLIARAEVLL